MMEHTKIERGWDLSHVGKVAELYEMAFGAKFATAINCQQSRVLILSKSFVPSFSYVVMVDDKIAGIAGFHTNAGSLTGGLSFAGLIELLGVFKGVKAALIFGLLERQVKEHELLMDGIAVDEQFRGSGYGSQLLDAIIEHAKNNGYKSVRLDVIDSNTRAKKLYESKGFVATQTEYFPYLKWLLGFSGSTTMVYHFENDER
ncbi:GNAT family N-acetyltransferase [Pseudoalteromonas sp. Of7M-16]|uniref:GNAT family N-acetyltransferase n=1 Tax=Pseudoalteromonas sp. Of7M-16 TaxID=2917756 RepID=UPI001EF481A3|nr:GNAT family N-acetyltransferase [Pseudoalteromonas sp. Of7M-16]MCG7551317.1 GNAT family N-acetyltransferase [Pseudoalteromonas sp. Of7M-16]